MAEDEAGANLAGLLAATRATLEGAEIDNAALDARLLVEHATGTGRIDALREPQMPVCVRARQSLQALLSRRLAGEPVHRIVGRREFYGLSLRLSPATLEPRPDTEILADLAIAEARRIVAGCGGCRVLDLGTGTGALAIAILSNVEGTQAVGTDISPEALETACANADIHRVGARFRPLRSDWFGKVDGTFHLIVSNPPYIATDEIALLAREVREHDPVAALDGGADGLDAYRAIAAGAAARLEPNGAVAVEIGHLQHESVARIFAQEGWLLRHGARDLAGNDRALVFAVAASS